MKSTKASENSTKAKPQQRPATPPQVSKATSLRARETRSNSIDNPEADPWASPAMHKGHAHTNLRESPPKTNGTLAARPIGNGNTGPSRTTSTFTTHSDRPTSISPTSVEVSPPGAAPGNASGGAWGYDNTDSGFSNPDQPGLDPTGFGSRGDEQNNSNRNPAGRSLGGGRTASRGVEEVVSITVLPEKEGMFMFQHRNYEVRSARRSSTVIRRYSDFVWLLDCLHKRYPFRQLPLLPPKRVAGKLTLFGDWCRLIIYLTSVNGRHLSSDVTFIEKRRRGLIRFTNALVRHPILCQEQLVVMFLTVPTVGQF